MTGDRMHRCAATGCERTTSLRMLMCLPCWKRVPQALQQKLWKSYRRADSQGRAVLSRAYVEAVRECRDAVAEARARERQASDGTHARGETRAQDAATRQGQLGLEP